MREHVPVPLEDAPPVTAVIYADPAAAPIRATLVLAHGAGANQDSAFMVHFGSGLAARGLETVTFNFQYTEVGRRIPDRGPKLEACYRAIVAWVRARSSAHAVFIGGKSMGGRIASQIAAAPAPDDPSGVPAVNVAGVVALGYPLHPPGRPDRLRTAHLPRIAVPMLVVQGERDSFGTEAELRPVLDGLPAAALHIVEGGDHSLNVRRKSAPPREEIHAAVMDEIVRWVRAIVE